MQKRVLSRSNTDTPIPKGIAHAIASMALCTMTTATAVLSCQGKAAQGTTPDTGSGGMPQLTTTFTTYLIQSNSDDADEDRATGTVVLDNYALHIGYDSATSQNKTIGLRFANVAVPPGRQLRSAYLRFHTNNDDSTGLVDLTIQGEAADNSATFKETDDDISGRPRTKASVVWSAPEWRDPWTSGPDHRSADISSVINEIIGRSGFASGNAITLLVKGTGSSMRSAYSRDYAEATGRRRLTRLILEWDSPTPTCDLQPAVLASDGETFLPDYSFAGYRWGEEPMPHLSSAMPTTTVIEVSSFGATPDDSSDDTQAIQKAIAANQSTPGTVLLKFPAGRFRLSNVLTINRSNFVLQGAGSGTSGTIFQIDIPLSDPSVTKSADVLDVEDQWTSGSWPTEDNGHPYSLYSWTGGFFYAHYDGDRYQRQTIANVTEARRGGHTLTVANAQKSFSVGDVVRLEWNNPADNSLLYHVCDNQPVTYGDGMTGEYEGLVAQPVTVTEVNGDLLEVKEPILHDVGQPGQEWTARLRTMFHIDNVGLEHFRIEFPGNTTYGGHHEEAGYNAIHIADVSHGWVRDVFVSNADSAVIIDSSRQVTIEGIATQGRKAHYNLYVGRSYGILARDFRLGSPALHNPSLNSDAVGCVFTSGIIDDAFFDQHMALNHQNLIDNVVVRYTANLFDHGGSSSAAPTAGAFNTFWNIAVQELPYDGLVGVCTDAPSARLIGLLSPGNTLSIDYTPEPYVEGLNRCSSVHSLYSYQLAQRTSGL